MTGNEKRAQTLLLKHRAMIAKAADKARKGVDKTSLKASGSVHVIRDMAYTFEDVLGEYLHTPTLRYIKGKLDPKHRSFGCFKRAAALAKEHNVDPETWIRSQFYWFDKWYNRAPKPRELCSRTTEHSSIWRLGEYLKLIASGEIRGGKVQSISFLTKLKPFELDKINQRRLADTMLVWGLTETQVFLKFAQRDAGYFDQQWLRKHPTYRKLKKAGKL